MATRNGALARRAATVLATCLLTGGLGSSTAAESQPETLRSQLYPTDWQPATPDAEGRFLHDFSYAGYQ